MDLLDFPQDILLRIFYNLEVREILRVERTCRSMRKYILHNARHLWLVKLYGLDVSCDPGIPPNVSVEHLPIEELRSIVVRAVRLYAAMTEPPTSMITYALRNTIVPAPPETTPNGMTGFIHSVRLVPGGRYVFVCWKMVLPNQGHADYIIDKEFCMIDTENSHQRAWSFDPIKCHGIVPTRTFLAYDFNVQKDGSIIMALVSQCEDENSNISGLFQVFRLSYESSVGAFVDSLLYSSSSESLRILSGDFVALFDYVTGIATLFKWDEGKMMKIAFEPSYTRNSYRIWNNHLFYVEFDLQELRAISLLQVIEFLDSSPDQRSTLRLQQLDTIRLQLKEYSDQNGRSLMPSGLTGTLFSIYDAPWKNNSEAVFTIISQVFEGLPYYSAIRAKFHANEFHSKDWTWEFLGTRTSSNIDVGVRYSFATPKPTRSGLLLTYSRKIDVLSSTLELVQSSSFPLWPELAIVAVDREGYPFIPRLSENMVNLIADAEEGRDAAKKIDSPRISPEGTGGPIRSSFPRKAVKVEDLDEYTGAIVVSRDKGSGKDSIEIYYPE
ncbi:hypothetical protein ACEPAH_1767 [Sanghuangporus vaninii]